MRVGRRNDRGTEEEWREMVFFRPENAVKVRHASNVPVGKTTQSELTDSWVNNKTELRESASRELDEHLRKTDSCTFEGGDDCLKLSLNAARNFKLAFVSGSEPVVLFSKSVPYCSGCFRRTGLYGSTKMQWPVALSKANHPSQYQYWSPQVSG